jgi:hypothetical protein
LSQVNGKKPSFPKRLTLSEQVSGHRLKPLQPSKETRNNYYNKSL